MKWTDIVLGTAFVSEKVIYSFSSEEKSYYYPYIYLVIIFYNILDEEKLNKYN